MASSTTLRAVTHRLTTTPVNQLPQIALFLATSLSDCAELLSAPQTQKNGKSDSDNAVQVHKLKSRLVSLLQDRSFEGRWTAVVLVKATVEAGQWEILRGCEPLVRGLLAILGKPDPVSTKKLCIITLTRIFHLTHQYQTLVREITTPSLPAFITASLNLVSVKPSSEPNRILKPNAPLLETVFHAFTSLIVRHPTVFRPFSAQIHSLVLSIIGAASSCAGSVVQLAQQLFIALHNCAPKNTGPEEWKRACQLTISSLHRTADHTFRAVVEQWESTDPSLRQASKPRDSSQTVGDDGPDQLGLPSWEGIHAGADRLTALLYLLSRFMTTQTTSTVNIPIGSILDLTTRLTSVTVPPDSDDASQTAIQLNPEIGREEREQLWSELPRIHVACMDLFLNMIDTLGNSIVPVAQNILEQALWIFQAEKFNKEVRTSLYHLIRRLLSLIGPTMTKANISSLASLFRYCCHDLLPQDADPKSQSQNQSSDPKSKSKSNLDSTNADAFLNPGLKNSHQSASSASSFPALHSAASQLLPALFTCLPIEYIPPSLRAEFDRTAILTRNKDAMLASVLNPMPIVKGRQANPSIMPFLAREYPEEMAVESLLRPRMPVLLGAPERNGFKCMDEDDDEEENNVARGVTYETTTTTTRTAQDFIGRSSFAASVDKSTTANAESTARDDPVNGHNKRSQDEGEGSLQTKKARVESTISPISLSAAGQASVSNTTATKTLSETSSVPATTTTPSVTAPSVVRMQSTSTQPEAKAGDVDDEEDSGDEIPALNLEPDTDEEDEDEDVTMEG
ncbi:hypothetical protein VTN00DRAFT_6230 [Thermoascus crustaceus]|uniref:uncharacterized protein n=1 Tax=Thermoascus crustaceus TaxID=5088 RepID=UPI0037438633